MEIINILNALYNNKKININEDDNLIYTAKKGYILPILYYVSNDDKYKSYYINNIIRNENLYNHYKAISKLFSDNKIDHIFFKGFLISEKYPDNHLRVMSDVDVIVRKKDYLMAYKLLKSNDYKYLRRYDTINESVFEKDNILIELHKSLFSPLEPKDINLFFDDIFKYSNKINDYCYKINDDILYIYYLLHFKRHYYSYISLKYLMDFYYLSLDDIDKNNELLNKFNLNELDNSIINLNNKIKNNIELNENDYIFLNNILNNKCNLKKDYKERRFYYFLKRVFLLDNSYRRIRYKILGRFYILYPLCVIVNFFKLIFNNLGHFFKFLFKRT